MSAGVQQSPQTFQKSKSLIPHTGLQRTPTEAETYSHKSQQTRPAAQGVRSRGNIPATPSVEGVRTSNSLQTTPSERGVRSRVDLQTTRSERGFRARVDPQTAQTEQDECPMGGSRSKRPRRSLSEADAESRDPTPRVIEQISIEKDSSGRSGTNFQGLSVHKVSSSSSFKWKSAKKTMDFVFLLSHRHDTQ